MKQEKIKEILEKNKNDWNNLAEEFSQTRHNLWFELEDLKSYVKKGDRILDLGCGNGRLFELFDQGVNYLGVDQSSRLIELAKTKFPSGNFIVADALNLPFKDEFDVIFSIALFHHLPSKELRLKVLKNCYTLLKPGGFLICMVWNFFQPWLIWKYNIGKIILGFRNVFIPFKARSGKIKRYYYAFTKRGLKNLVKKAGFKGIKCYYVRKGQPVGRLKGYNLILIVKKNG